MTDLAIFVGIAGLVVVVGIVVGMIVAGRIDRIMSPAQRPPATGDLPAVKPQAIPEPTPEQEQQQ